MDEGGGHRLQRVHELVEGLGERRGLPRGLDGDDQSGQRGAKYGVRPQEWEPVKFKVI